MVYREGNYYDNFEVQDSIMWHSSKDQHLYDTKNKIINPMVSMIMWPFQQETENSFLEITKVKQEGYKNNYDCSETERIEVKSNRLIIYDGSYIHRLSPIKEGIAWSFSVNVWDKETSITEIGVY